MVILLTGCTGFVGSALGPRLIGAGHEVVCICRPDTSVTVGEKIVWDGASPIPAGMFPKNVDAVVHLAQSRSYRQFPADSREMFAVNVAMTMSLLQWAAQSKVERFCLISSGAVYEPFSSPLREDAALAPTGFLAASKLAAEVIATPFSACFALSTLRLFFPYGPGQHHRLVPELIRRVRNGQAVQLAANGEGTRLTPTFVGDIVEVILAMIASTRTGTLNVAAPEVLSIRQIAGEVGRQLGIEPKFEVVDRLAADIVPNLDRLSSRFELNRFMRFEDGLRRTLFCDPDRTI